jgi:hypothetical protein
MIRCRDPEEAAMPLPSPFNIFPFAGGNWQTIDTNWWSPNVTVNFAGNPAIEREVTEDVASYGRQIGWLSDIVVALADDDAGPLSPAAADSLTKLRDAREQIEAIKRRRADSAEAAARRTLANLGKTDPAAYARLIGSLDPKRTPGA